MSETTAAVERFFVVSPIERVDVRDGSANHDNTWTMSGYAAVLNHKATVFDNKFMKATVQLDARAFDRVMAEQPFTEPSGVVHFNRGHDMDSAVAATDVPEGQPGSLKLSMDRNGLHFLARVSRDDPDGISLASKMRTGVIKQASFAFNAGANEFTVIENPDGTEEEHRLITEVAHIYDVCACPQGLFSQTVSGLQAYALHLGQPDLGGHRRQPDLGGANSVSPDAGGREDITPPSVWQMDLAAFLAQADHLKPIGGNTEGIRDVRTGQGQKPTD